MRACVCMYLCISTRIFLYLQLLYFYVCVLNFVTLRDCHSGIKGVFGWPRSCAFCEVIERSRCASTDKVAAHRYAIISGASTFVVLRCSVSSPLLSNNAQLTSRVVTTAYRSVSVVRTVTMEVDVIKWLYLLLKILAGRSSYNYIQTYW